MKNISKKIVMSILFFISGTSFVLEAGATPIQKGHEEKGLFLRNFQGPLKEISLGEGATVDGELEGASRSQELSLFILQLQNPIREKAKLALTQAGFEIFSYIPEDALIVRITPAGLSHYLGNPSKEALPLRVVHYNAPLKLSPGLGVFSILNSSVQLVAQVQLFRDSDWERFQEKWKGRQVLALDRAGRFLRIECSRWDLYQLAEEAEVEFVEQVAEFQNMIWMPDEDVMREISEMDSGQGDYTDLNGIESGTQIMKFSSAWEMGYRGEGQVVAMADTGLDSGDENQIHRDFSGAIREGQVVGLFSKSWADPMGHGTHVAGSILGRGTASGGLLRGGANGAAMVVQGMWSPMLDNLSVPSKMGELFDRAYRAGARIHSNSWGSPKSLGEYDGFANQTDEYLFKNPDLLVLFAAGNSGVDHDRNGRIDPGSVSSPGTAKNVLTVGASENEVSFGGIQLPAGKLRQGPESWAVEPIASDRISNNRNGLAMFSSRGPTVDQRIKPEVVAPGTNILSVRSQQNGASPLWGIYNHDYVWAGGTSMATPLTAGAAAVAREYLQKTEKIQTPSAALLKAFIMNRAQEMFPGQYGQGGELEGQEILKLRPNSDEGYGRVDVSALVGFSGNHLWDERKGVDQDGERRYEIRLDEPKSKLWISLVWGDAPASPAAGKTLVNDLDLEVFGPNGSKLALASDHTNNHEYLELHGLEVGSYQIVVRGHRIPSGIQGFQPFALVVSAL